MKLDRKKRVFPFGKPIRLYWQTDLSCLEQRLEQRLFLYLSYWLLIGAATFASLLALGVWRSQAVSQEFQGMYAWHTILNFGLIFLTLMEGWRLLRQAVFPRIKLRISSLWWMGLLSFAVAYVLQRTVVYNAIGGYKPELLRYYETFVCQRPKFWPMSFWCFSSWLPAFGLLTGLVLWHKSRLGPPIYLLPRPVTTRWSLDGGRLIVIVEQITHLSMEDHYARIFWRTSEGEGKEALVRLPLKEAMQQLPQDRFLQIHRSHLVNLDSVEGVTRKGRGWAAVIGDTMVPVSRNRITELKDRLAGLNASVPSGEPRVIRQDMPS